MNNKGFIPISRAIFDDQFWLENRAYSRFEAWLDLIQAVRFEDGTQYVSAYRKVELHRGQLVGSIRYLANRWGWSTKKVRTYLEYLVDENRIVLETPKGTGSTTITLCNYDRYNPVSPKKGTQKDTVGAQQGHSKGTNIRKNKLNKVNNIPPIVPQGGDAREQFEVFRKAYGGTVRGLETEFVTLQKHKDWKDVIPQLYPALEREIHYRERQMQSGEFCPEWANLQTWLNQRRWEQEFNTQTKKETSSHGLKFY